MSEQHKAAKPAKADESLIEDVKEQELLLSTAGVRIRTFESASMLFAFFLTGFGAMMLYTGGQSEHSTSLPAYLLISVGMSVWFVLFSIRLLDRKPRTDIYASKSESPKPLTEEVDLMRGYARSFREQPPRPVETKAETQAIPADALPGHFPQEVHWRIAQTVEYAKRDTLKRLLDEVSALEGRGTYNLIIGGIVAAVGVGFLGWFAFQIKEKPTQWLDLVYTFGPRLSLVILLEVISFFFLRLYKSSLTEIKFFQNEMTTVQAVMCSVQTAAHSNDITLLQTTIGQLSKTERNRLLAKGETTVELEAARLDRAVLTEALKAVAGVSSKTNGKKEE
jgi:hypothetical protein